MNMAGWQTLGMIEMLGAVAYGRYVLAPFAS
jgi:hypothetical protein